MIALHVDVCFLIYIYFLWLVKLLRSFFCNLLVSFFERNVNFYRKFFYNKKNSLFGFSDSKANNFCVLYYFFPYFPWLIETIYNYSQIWVGYWRTLGLSFILIWFFFFCFYTDKSLVVELNDLKHRKWITSSTCSLYFPNSNYFFFSFFLSVFAQWQIVLILFNF